MTLTVAFTEPIDTRAAGGLMPDLRMVVLGDSVPWGQGLETAEKFYSLVKVALTGSDCSQSCTLLAHSGATIGAGVETTQAPIDGEVPTSYPTILQQCAAFADSPETVDLVILNGGINDVDFRTIVNPFTDRADLEDLIKQYCFVDMKALLESVVTKFTKPTARVVVTGYFPILSDQSHPPLIDAFLAMIGVSTPPFLDVLDSLVLDKIAAHCALFYDESSRFFQKAIRQINRSPEGANRVLFAQPPFTAANAALAPDAWLWGVNLDLSPQDPMKDARHGSCDLFETDAIQRLTCYRASVGHPNLIGAQKYADAILAALQ
jgi:lysophospholipase L1-like esterase